MMCEPYSKAEPGQPGSDSQMLGSRVAWSVEGHCVSSARAITDAGITWSQMLA